MDRLLIVVILATLLVLLPLLCYRRVPLDAIFKPATHRLKMLQYFALVFSSISAFFALVFGFHSAVHLAGILLFASFWAIGLRAIVVPTTPEPLAR